MKWVLINMTHVNTNNIDCFRWEDGKLYVWFVAEKIPSEWDDPDRELYLRLCRQQGIRPYEEERNG